MLLRIRHSKAGTVVAWRTSTTPRGDAEEGEQTTADVSGAEGYGREFFPQPIQAPLTRILGRDADLDAIIDSLQQPHLKLLTITGSGGVGKTRLAIEAARRLGATFSTIAFVQLAPLRQSALVLPTIAKALGIAEPSDMATVEAIARYPSGSLLLVLDNLEQLPDAGISIAELLSRGDQIKALVTSRSPLRVRGEQTYPLMPLALPPRVVESDSAQIERLQLNAAIQLFVDRAREANPSFTLTPNTVQTVSEICWQLDGLPLAIELAAARSRALSPSALLSRLDNRMAILRDGPRDLPDRQQTMRSAVLWSYELLTPRQKALFRHLSVFAGGADLRAIGAVVEGDERDVVDDLVALVDSSLVLRAPVERDEPRYIMLETVRELGRELLQEHGELDAAQGRHAAHFRSFVEGAYAYLSGGQRTSWLARIDDDHDNVRAALTSLAAHRDARGLLLMAGCLWRFWWWRSYLHEGRSWIDRALSLADDLGLPAVSAERALALTGAAALAETVGDYAVADRQYADSIAIWKQLGDIDNQAVTLLFRWLIAFNAEDHERMNALAAESLALFQRSGNTWGIAMSLMERGIGEMRRHEIAATATLNEAIALFRAQGDLWGASLSLGALSMASLDRNDIEASAAQLREGLQDLLLLEDRWGVATLLPAAARLAMERRDLERVIRLSAAAVAAHEALGAPLKPPFRGMFEQNLALARAALGEDMFATHWTAGKVLSMAEAVQLAVSNESTNISMIERSILSSRELEVLRLAAGFATDREIADALFISYRTVTTHIVHILNKLGVNTRHEAVAAAQRLGLL
jgi:predicted ATPase/DNA-binding CsgD family transcriptional regulator